MYCDDYIKELSEIQSRLEKIDKHTANGGVLDLAGLSNAYFFELYKKHTEIARLSLELADQLVKQGAKKR